MLPACFPWKMVKEIFNPSLQSLHVHRHFEVYASVCLTGFLWFLSLWWKQKTETRSCSRLEGSSSIWELSVECCHSLNHSHFVFTERMTCDEISPQATSLKKGREAEGRIQLIRAWCSRWKTTWTIIWSEVRSLALETASCLFSCNHTQMIKVKIFNLFKKVLVMLFHKIWLDWQRRSLLWLAWTWDERNDRKMKFTASSSSRVVKSVDVVLAIYQANVNAGRDRIQLLF